MLSFHCYASIHDTALHKNSKTYFVSIWGRCGLVQIKFQKRNLSNFFYASFRPDTAANSRNNHKNLMHPFAIKTHFRSHLNQKSKFNIFMKIPLESVLSL